MRLKVEAEYDTDCQTLEEAQIELEESFARENTTASVEFWENMKLVEDEENGKNS